MATPTQVNDRRRLVQDVVTMAMSDLVGAWPAGGATGAEVRLKIVLPQLVDAYGSTMGTLSANWYDQLRDEAQVAGRYVAAPAALPNAGRVEALAGWAASPLYADDAQLAMVRAAGGLQRIISNAGRETIVSAVSGDPASATFVRQAASGACAFCAMLSTRSAVYASKRAALKVVGRATRSGVQERGSRQAGERYHDYCRCEAVPYWRGQTLTLGSADADYLSAYATASQKASGTKAVLAEMRAALGSS